jgi:hypothetical protein
MMLAPASLIYCPMVIDGLAVTTFYDRYPTMSGANFIAIGWKKFIGGRYQVSVIYGGGDGENEMLVTGRKDFDL